ncbi:MAG: exonuclease domain-containing protein, partial [Buchnera aphidicola]|nr:DNA polymerase III subunit epsilon [Buchnera aphidicola]MDE5285821.1 exonuclease domain-containing protein [Buchnera aphidicola]
HNASFDLGFIEQEFNILRADIKPISKYCSVIDTLKIARSLFPGKKNTLDALCTRYKINKSHRTLHSAIVDARLLGKLYLLMTGGQEVMSFLNVKEKKETKHFKKYIRNNNIPLKILRANTQEN